MRLASEKRVADGQNPRSGTTLPDAHFGTPKPAETQDLFGPLCKVQGADMSAVKTWQERATAKRRKAAVERALRYLNEGLAGLPSARKGTAEKRVRASAQPMRTARALVKDWRSRARATEPSVGDRPDLSAATEARAALLRRQPLALRRSAAYEDELAELERKLVNGSLSQQAFNGRCQKISERTLPRWMDNYQPPATVRSTPGSVQGYGPLPDKIDMPPVPSWLQRHEVAKNDKRDAA